MENPFLLTDIHSCLLFVNFYDGCPEKLGLVDGLEDGGGDGRER